MRTVLKNRDNPKKTFPGSVKTEQTILTQQYFIIFQYENKSLLFYFNLVPMEKYVFLRHSFIDSKQEYMTIIPENRLTSFREGHEETFRYYYEMYYDSLCIFGTRMLKEEEVAIDIVQDVFVNLWKAKETIESGLHLKMFIYQSMRHRCLNYIRIKKLEEKYQNECKLLASEEGFADMVVEEEVYRLVMKEIDELPSEQRKVILMHLEGKNNIEIAEIMHISVNTVRTHKARARQALKTKLNNLFIISIILGF